MQTATVTFTGGLSATLMAGADAVGTETLASVAAELTVVDRGLISYASGSIAALAAAEATDTSSFATTYVMAEAAGADLVVTNTADAAGQQPDAAVATSTLDVLALDCKWLDLELAADEHHGASAPDVSLSGNLAEFTAEANAVGDNTLADVYGDAFALEDSFSTAAISATAAVTGTTTYEMTIGTRHGDTITSLTGNALVQAGDGRDTIVTGLGDDWIFAGDGADRTSTGAGNDTVLAGDGADCLEGGNGADWLFGEAGNDTLHGGNGDDLILGGRGHDRIDGGDGNDLIDAGEGRDEACGGGGDDTFRLGAAGGDGNDDYRGGSGADLYALVGDFGRDTIWDFSLADGDRLHFGDGLTLEGMSRRGHDLEFDFEAGCGNARLTLENFFSINADCYSLPRGNHLGNALTQQLLIDVAASDYGDLGRSDATLFEIAGYLADLG